MFPCFNSGRGTTRRSVGNANEAFERPRVSLGSPSAPFSPIVPNRPDERSATSGPTHGR